MKPVERPRRLYARKLLHAFIAVIAAALVCAAPALAASYPANSASPPVPAALVDITTVSNGCGPGSASAETQYGDDSTFVNSNVPGSNAEKYLVNFREACKLHDAGYSGAEVADAVNGGYVDYFAWTKDQVDAKFLDDMRKICAKIIPAEATIALHDCRWQGGFHTVSGAYTRYLIVRTPGAGVFFRKRPHLNGLWVNKVAPNSGPAWALVQHGRAVKASWRGGAGHTGLRGSFTGTIVTHVGLARIEVRF